jgi:hypothetical protein
MIMSDRSARRAPAEVIAFRDAANSRQWLPSTWLIVAGVWLKIR